MPDPYTLADLGVAGEYVGALAVAGAAAEISVRRFAL